MESTVHFKELLNVAPEDDVWIQYAEENVDLWLVGSGNCTSHGDEFHGSDDWESTLMNPCALMTLVNGDDFFWTMTSSDD